ncbi:DUF3152 domain-containing protein [Catellatospora sp. KI3]|uniref:DUF3152 domain-containing protein n=1 Tax=Catellatospora sp. KI3 TaxID=3041620 RepID=UPI00248282AD|nr:DUF3152 domain-containing protein [Catellatospora sp. KI3]MDI1460330.1 DUF3152 domain-containing protein [Catellatospora sp. KI3]
MGRTFSRARVATVALVLSLLAAGCGEQPHPRFEAAPSPSAVLESAAASPSAVPSPAPKPSPSVKPSASPKPVRNGNVLKHGAGTFRTAAGGTGVVGTAGTLRTYHVQVENGITAFDPDSFAAAVDLILADPHSWIASKKWRFKRVTTGTSPNFYIRLATPDTMDRMCGTAGLDTAGIFSCQYGNNVMINLYRWTNGATGFTDLDVYRNMVVNHETGHYLGHGHVFCPGAGRTAPVMQQQTKSLQGCKANPYPYPDGVHYVG